MLTNTQQQHCSGHQGLALGKVASEECIADLVSEVRDCLTLLGTSPRHSDCAVLAPGSQVPKDDPNEVCFVFCLWIFFNVIFAIFYRTKQKTPVVKEPVWVSLRLSS